MSGMALELDVQAVAKLRQEKADFVLLDVREQSEYETALIEGSLHLPMSELRQRINELDPFREQHVIVHCHHGMRSLQVAEALVQYGFTKVQSMSGGIDDWSLQIDTSVPRY